MGPRAASSGWAVWAAALKPEHRLLELAQVTAGVGGAEAGSRDHVGAPALTGWA